MSKVVLDAAAEEVLRGLVPCVTVAKTVVTSAATLEARASRVAAPRRRTFHILIGGNETLGDEDERPLYF